jgi:RNA 2',3'-cyclic 3'-phosphodiesterase
MRVFIGINFPKEVLTEIEKIQSDLPDFSGKKIKSENLHLTLKFLGNLNSNKLEEVKKRLNQINFGVINSEINSIGFFSKRLLRVVWLHVSGFDELQKRVDSVLKDIFSKEKRFMGHVTIARIKNLPDKDSFMKKIEIFRIKKISFQIKSFYLIESKLGSFGSEYKILEEYPLQKI